MIIDDPFGIVQEILKCGNSLSILNNQNVLDLNALRNPLNVRIQSIGLSIDVEVIAGDDLVVGRVRDPVVGYEGARTVAAVVGNHVGRTGVGASDSVPVAGLVAFPISVAGEDHRVNGNVLTGRIQGVYGQIQRHFASVAIEGITCAVGMNSHVIVSRIVVPVYILVLDQNGSIHIILTYRDLQLSCEQGVHRNGIRAGGALYVTDVVGRPFLIAVVLVVQGVNQL